jgi:hypothetical protein
MLNHSILLNLMYSFFIIIHNKYLSLIFTNIHLFIKEIISTIDLIFFAKKYLYRFILYLNFILVYLLIMENYL